MQAQAEAVFAVSVAAALKMMSEPAWVGRHRRAPASILAGAPKTPPAVVCPCVLARPVAQVQRVSLPLPMVLVWRLAPTDLVFPYQGEVCLELSPVS